MQSPIFIFSLPRAGSTLLQRILMSHEKICSVAEPWLLLPQIFALRKKGMLSKYSSLTANQGISSFIQNLPEGRKDYNESLSKFVYELYEKQCQNQEVYFLDKTPRYYLIIDEIVELFPDAKFIFLFRNPVHIYASIINTWGKGRLNRLFSNYYDLTIGFKALSEGYEKHKGRSISLRYEDLITNSKEELKRLLDYLEIDLNENLLNDFKNQETKGTLGDPTGTKAYKNISAAGLQKWQTTFNSVFRKKVALNYLKKLDVNDLEVQGYNKTKLTSEIKQIKATFKHSLLKDIKDYYFSILVRRFKLNLKYDKQFNWIKNEYLS